jgi:type 1 fimbria pilin
MRWRWAFALSAVLVLTATSCAKPSESQQVADSFMDLYYTRMSVGEAVKLCRGAARTRLEGELRSLQGVPPDAPAGEPRVTFSLTASTNPTPTEATYTYRVTAHTADVGQVVAALTLTNEGGHWLVTSLSEEPASPTP